MILVSSCLLGLNCRYDQSEKPNKEVIAYLKDKAYLPVCPEQMGGLSTPRPACEITGHAPLVISTQAGEDKTDAFLMGVDQVLKLIEGLTIDKAILKAKSPSCGSDEIYNGRFEKQIILGQGVLTKALRQKNISVFHEHNFK